MRKLSSTDALAALVVVSGLVAVVGFALSNIALGGATLGVAVILLAVLVRGGIENLARAQRELATNLVTDLNALQAKTDLVIRGNRKVMRDSVRQADRIESQVGAHMKRVIADVSTFRLEVADADRVSSASQPS
ncbi:MAG: hypothetical protein ACRDT9_04435 [Agromyces sp.]